MFCTKCGHSQWGNPAFCRTCGESLQVPVPAVAPVNKKSLGMPLKAFLVGCMVVTILIGLLTVVSVAQNDDDSTSQASTVRPPTTTTTLPSTPQGTGVLYAVVVGVSDYQNDDGSVITDLVGPDGGAKRTTDMLNNLWGDRAHVRLLVNSDASKANIQQAIASIQSQATDNDTVLFYFSGHGNETYLAPYDSLLNSYSRDISTGLLDQWLDTLQSKKVIVVVDSCHSGGYAERIAQQNRVVLASCAANEMASTELSDYITLGLSQPQKLDADADSRISIEEIHTYLSNQRIQGQHPQLADRYPGELELISLVTG